MCVSTDLRHEATSRLVIVGRMAHENKRALVSVCATGHPSLPRAFGLSAIHGRPQFAKHSFLDLKKGMIAANTSGLLTRLRAPVPDRIHGRPQFL